MKTFVVNMSDQEAEEYKISKREMNLNELVKKISSRKALDALDLLHKEAKKVGLDKMTMGEIDDEIQAMRNEKRNS